MLWPITTATGAAGQLTIGGVDSPRHMMLPLVRHFAWQEQSRTFPIAAWPPPASMAR